MRDTSKGIYMDSCLRRNDKRAFTNTHKQTPAHWQAGFMDSRFRGKDSRGDGGIGVSACRGIKKEYCLYKKLKRPATPKF